MTTVEAAVRPASCWYMVYVGLMLRDFKEDTFEVMNIIYQKENGEPRMLVQIAKRGELAVERIPIERFWEQVEVSPGVWKMRFTPADSTPLIWDEEVE
jgi:hypothetical protein